MNRKLNLGFPPRGRGTPEAIGDRIRGWGAAANDLLGSGSSRPPAQQPPAQQAPAPLASPSGQEILQESLRRAGLGPNPQVTQPSGEEHEDLGPQGIMGAMPPGGIGPPNFLPSVPPEVPEGTELTDEEIDAAMEKATDGDGNVSWGKVFQMITSGVGKIAGSPLGTAAVGAALGHATGAGALMGGVAAVTGRFEGQSEAEVLRQKYEKSRNTMAKSLLDGKVKNLKFLHEQQIKGSRFDQAKDTMAKITTLTNTPIAKSDLDAIYNAQAKTHAMGIFDANMTQSLDGIFGKQGEAPDLDALSTWQARTLNDDAVVRMLSNKGPDQAVSQKDRDSASRALKRHIGSYGFEAQQEYSKAEHSNYMDQAETEAQISQGFWRRFTEGMRYEGANNPSNAGLDAFANHFAGDRNTPPMYPRAAAQYPGLKNPQKQKLLLDNVSHVLASGKIDRYRQVFEKSYNRKLSNSEVIMSLINGVVTNPKDIAAVSAVIAKHETLPATKPGAGPAAPTPAPGAPRPGVAGPPASGAPRPTPAGLGSAHRTIQQDNLADRVITALMDNPDLANAASPEDMLTGAASKDPALKQAISDKAVQQALSIMFNDTTKYKKFVTPGTPEHDLISVQRGGGGSRDWITGENLLSSKKERVKRARKVLASADKKDADLVNTTKDLLAHYRSDSRDTYLEKIPYDVVDRPYDRDRFMIGFKSEVSDDILKGQPEYDEILKAGVPEKQALDVFKEALLTQKHWKDTEANPLMRSGENTVRDRLAKLRAKPSNTGAVATAEPSAPVTSSPPATTVGSSEWWAEGKVPQRGSSGGWADGNVPQRNNSPGNVKAGGVADQWAIRKPDGSLDVDKDGHLKFETPEDGFKAMEADVTAKISGDSPATRKKLKKDNAETVDELGKVYAEDPNWSSNVKSILKRDHGIDADSVHINQIPIPALVDSISKAEGYLDE